MPEQPQETQPQDTQQTQPQQTPVPDAPNGNAAGQQVGAPEKTFSQADVERIVTERLERERKAAESKALKAREDAERKAAEEQGKFKELYEQLQTRLEETERAKRDLELGQLKRAAADKVGLPAALAERLRGETADELERDAKEVLAALPKPGAPNINNGVGGQNAGSMDEARRLEYAARLGVNPKYFRPG